jgi:hypothetical protein
LEEDNMRPFGVNVCISGGAEGADLQFGMVAGSKGHTVIHFHFKGHKSNAPKSELVELTNAHLLAADVYLQKANLTMKRKYPTSSNFVNNLLRRNWYQVENSGSCYAVSTIKNGMVQGGTAWATQMFIDKNDGAACDCFVYCQAAGQWFKWEGEWVVIETPPVPSGIWAGVGSRDLKDSGKNAIRTLLGWNKNESNED